MRPKKIQQAPPRLAHPRRKRDSSGRVVTRLLVTPCLHPARFLRDPRKPAKGRRGSGERKGNLSKGEDGQEERALISLRTAHRCVG